jgi:hypothetical protein
VPKPWRNYGWVCTSSSARPPTPTTSNPPADGYADNARRICFCTDDRQPPDLLDEGHIDFMVRTAIAQGVPPVTAFRMATLNPANISTCTIAGPSPRRRRAI